MHPEGMRVGSSPSFRVRMGALLEVLQCSPITDFGDMRPVMERLLEIA
jgi:hypothetical protein